MLLKFKYPIVIITITIFSLLSVQAQKGFVLSSVIYTNMTVNQLQQLFQELLEQGVFMVTRVRKNMKNKLMSLVDKALLVKHSLLESVVGKIKLLGKLEHSRHRLVTNAFVHMVAALINYQLSNDKPSILPLL